MPYPFEDADEVPSAADIRADHMLDDRIAASPPVPVDDEDLDDEDRPFDYDADDREGETAC